MEHHEWGWMIVVYLFVGGLGAGSLVLSGAAHLSRKRHLQGVARAGALLAPLLVGAGSGLLIFDLGQPLRFWRLFTTINTVSPMSIGSWFLMLFSGIAAVYALLQLPPTWLEKVAGRLPFASKLATWNRSSADALDESTDAAVRFPGSPGWVSGLRTLLALVGIPLGLGVGIYTGVLLGAIPARPFWNTPIVAQLFLFSALSTATALMMLVAPRVWRGHPSERESAHRTLLRADLVFIFLELFIIIPFIVHGELSTLSARESLNMILGGPYTMVFWLGVVCLGILTPLFIEIIDAIGGLKLLPGFLRGALHVVVPVMILVGGYLLRWVFVHAGQDTHFL